MTTLRTTSPRTWRPRARLAAALLALTHLPFTAVAGSAPATAVTAQFRGMNWAVSGDNFSTSPLVLDGLSSSDSYDTVRAKANALYDDMESTLGVNTVRLPVNTHTVGTAWWGAYRGTIDAATARGWKVILGYWEDGAASGGRITNPSAWNSMWNTILSQYSSVPVLLERPRLRRAFTRSGSAWRPARIRASNVSRSSSPSARAGRQTSGIAIESQPSANRAISVSTRPRVALGTGPARDSALGQDLRQMSVQSRKELTLVPQRWVPRFPTPINPLLSPPCRRAVRRRAATCSPSGCLRTPRWRTSGDCRYTPITWTGSTRTCARG